HVAQHARKRLRRRIPDPILLGRQLVVEDRASALADRHVRGAPFLAAADVLARAVERDRDIGPRRDFWAAPAHPLDPLLGQARVLGISTVCTGCTSLRGRMAHITAMMAMTSSGATTAIVERRRGAGGGAGRGSMTVAGSGVTRTVASVSASASTFTFNASANA